MAVTTEIGGKARGVLRFDVRGGLLAALGGPGKGSVTASNAGMTADLGVVFTGAESSVIAANTTLKARLNRIMDNLGKRLVDMARDQSTKTYKTGLFKSSWRYTKDTGSQGLKTVIALVNPTPYALYVHRKGWRPRGARSGWPTVVNVLIKPRARVMMQDAVTDIVNDRVLMRGIASAIVAGAAAGGRR
jgi:hypothetical protein